MYIHYCILLAYFYIILLVLLDYKRIMSFFVRGKECDPKGTFSHYLSSNAIFDCIDHATDFILHNDLYEYMECFSLKRRYEGDGSMRRHFKMFLLA